jgi:hypothetical protein
MKKFLIVSLLAALVVPAVSLGGPTGQDRENAARACRALRATLGVELFRQTYGTVQSNRRNAFGKCVSQWTRAEHQNRISARAACSAEQADANFPATHDGKTFQEFYGKNKNGKNAFGKCVSTKARALKAKEDEADAKDVAEFKNAAKQCQAESDDPDFPASHDGKSFSDFYGTNKNHRNAFGKCVSSKVKEDHYTDPMDDEDGDDNGGNGQGHKDDGPSDD